MSQVKLVSATRALAAVVASLSIAAVAACGPSFQAIYEGNVRFEHCYALEENPQTPLVEKGDCWRDWSERYTYGQTRDRINYATARYVALSQVPNVPTDEAMMMAAPGMTPRQSTITAPAPSNAFAPPPKVLDEADSGPGSRPSERTSILGHTSARDAGTGATPPPPSTPVAPPAPSLPAADCGEGCGRAFKDCELDCGAPDAGAGALDAGRAPGKAAKACAECSKTYRACMRGCFK